MANTSAGRDMINATAGHDAINIGRDNNIMININDRSRGGAASGSNDVKSDLFQPSFHVPSNPREVVLDFGNPLDRTHPHTQEARVLQEVLRDGCNERDTRVIVIHGKGGVGKSCILRGLAKHEKVKEKFPDGVYFLSFGMDADVGTLIRALTEIIRLSGGQILGTELCGEDNLQIVLKRVGEWLSGKTCLLLADDFWQENGLEANVVTELAEMLSALSVLVLTTRFSAVATKGTEIEIKPFGTVSEEAKGMLLRYSKFDWQEVDQENVRSPFDTLLRMCGGLPIFVAIVGKAVARIALRIKDKSERTSAWEECVCMLEDSELLETNVEGYKGLGRTLHMSLKLLSQDYGILFKELSPYSLGEMHRALCVFKKQAVIPISACRRLWKVRSDGVALKLGMAFADVGLADVEIERKSSRQVRVVRLHDLVQIFAMKCAKTAGEVTIWHDRLLEGYISKAGCGESVRRWWGAEEKSGEEYLFGNLCRHLASSGNVKELAGLLLSGEWTKFRVKHGGLSAWKQDFSEYEGRKIALALSDKEKQTEDGVRMVKDAVVESWVFVHENQHELGFQMFGRLVDSKNEYVKKYLESVERMQRGRWLKPMQRLWTRPGEGGMTAEFDLRGEIWDIAVQRDPFIVLAAVAKEVVIIDLKEMRVRSRCIGHAGEVWKVGISADGKRVFSWSDDCTVRQWDAQSGTEDTGKRVELDDEGIGEHSDEGYDYDGVTCAAFCLDKSLIITGSEKGRLNIWDLSSGEKIGHVMEATESVRCIEVSSNGRLIVAGLDGGAVLLWDMQTCTPLGGELKGHSDYVRSVALSQDNRAVVSAGGWKDRTIRLWNVADSTQVGDPFANCKDDIYSVIFSADGQQIISGHFGGWITVWDVVSGTARRFWDAHSHLVHFVAVTSDEDSQYVVSAGGEGIVRVWGLHAAANARDERIQHDGVVEFVAASPNGRFFVSASWDKTLRIWDAANRTALGEALCGHEREVTCVAVSPDNRRLVSGSRDCTVRVWEVATGAQVGDALQGHRGWVTCVVYSEDGRFVVSGSNDCTARLWRVFDNPEVDERVGERVNEGGRLNEPGVRQILSSQQSYCLDMILNHELPDESGNLKHGVESVTMSPDGQRVLSGLRNGEIWVWDRSSGKCTCRTRSDKDSWIVRMDIFNYREVVTNNLKYEELRWWLDEEGCLMRVQQNENKTGTSLDESLLQSELQAGSVYRWLSSVVCHGRTVHWSGSSERIATLSEEEKKVNRLLEMI